MCVWVVWGRHSILSNMWGVYLSSLEVSDMQIEVDERGMSEERICP